jgi:serine/threonine-protein kinase
MLQPGTIIGGYRIDGLIGRGAMGEVYRAMQLSLKRPVAVKRIAAHLLQEPQAVARFEREAQCVARVQSQHVVAVHDFGRHADGAGEQHWLLVMELVDGGASLGRLLAERGGRLDWRTASSIALQVAEGLAAAGEFAVVHRDIKPDNILISRKGVAKVTDFGLAKASDSSAMTASGAVLGTPLYMPPEACRGAEVDARGDLYSLGCTWFHCLAGQPPFRAASSVALLRAHCEEAAPDVRLFAPDTPMALAELVSRLLAKPADQRPSSARELVSLIEGLAARGIALPRSVPEVLGSESQQATAVTQVAEGATAATLRVGSDADGTAATRLAAATAATAVPASTAAAPARRRRMRLAVGAVALLAVAGVLAAALRPGDRFRGVHEALAQGDPGMALQRAEALLAARPDDAGAVAAVRESIQAEVARLADGGRYEDARKRLAEHHARLPWLDTGAWERQLAVAEAGWLAKHDRADEAGVKLQELRKAAPDDLDLCRSVLAILGDDMLHTGLMIGSAYTLAKQGSGALEPAAVKVLVEYLRNNGPNGDSEEEVRTMLLRRHPAIVDTLKPWLDSKEYVERGNAMRLLAAAGKLGDGEAIRGHLRNVLELSSSYTISTESLAWLASEAAKPDWPARKAAAALPPIAKVEALDTWNEHADAVIALLASAFTAEVAAPAHAWLAAEEEDLRWNAYKLLDQAHLLGDVDVRGFHATTLTTFAALYESPPFLAAVAWCTARSGTAEAAIARDMLGAGAKHVETEIAQYEKADMGSRARTCRARLEQITKARASISVP